MSEHSNIIDINPIPQTDHTNIVNTQEVLGIDTNKGDVELYIDIAVNSMQKLLISQGLTEQAANEKLMDILTNKIANIQNGTSTEEIIQEQAI